MYSLIIIILLLLFFFLHYLLLIIVTYKSIKESSGVATFRLIFLFNTIKIICVVRLIRQKFFKMALSKILFFGY